MEDVRAVRSILMAASIAPQNVGHLVMVVPGRSVLRNTTCPLRLRYPGSVVPFDINLPSLGPKKPLVIASPRV